MKPIDEQGDILTNYHVVENTQKLSVSLGGGKNYSAKVIGSDPDTDLAVIRLTEQPKETLTIVPMGDSDKLDVGRVGVSGARSDRPDNEHRWRWTAATRCAPECGAGLFPPG